MNSSAAPRVLIAGTGFEDAPRFLGEVMPEAAIEGAAPGKLEQAVATANVLIPNGAAITADVLQHAQVLRLIHQWGAGLENVDIAAATRLNIPVANARTTDTGAADAIAEWCVMMAIALSRGFPRIQAQVRAGHPWGAPAGLTLLGQTAGVIGLGGIGQALVRHLRPFGMRLVAIKREIQPGLAEHLGLDWMGTLADLPRLLQVARYIFVCVPQTPETRDLLGASEFAQVTAGALLINPARAAIVNRSALLDALAQGQLAGAALDVFWQEPPDPADPLLQMSNVLVTPHISGVTILSYQRVAAFLANNIRRVFAGQLPVNCVNPEVQNR